METIWHDVRFGIRVLIRSQGYLFSAVATLAIGVAANTIMFSLVNPLLLHSLPYKNPDRLVAITEKNTNRGDSPWGVSPLEFNEWQRHAESFEDLGAIRNRLELLMTGSGIEPLEVRVAHASSGFFPLLGIQPILGRPFSEQEEQQVNAPALILSYSTWKSGFGGDTNVIGRSVALNGVSVVVVGVLPADFQFRREYDVWLPQPGPSATGIDEPPTVPVLTVVGHLKPGVRPAQAQAEIDGIQESYVKAYPAHRGIVPFISPLQEFYLNSRNTRERLILIFAIVGLVLLICCANITNLTLARASTRQKEVAIRLSLGATRGRLVRQLITESLLLSIVGGILGIVVAAFGLTWVKGVLPPTLPNFRPGSIRLDGEALAFSLVISLLAGLISGLTPAVQASRPGLNDSLKEGGRDSSGSRQGGKVRSFLVAFEFAIAMIVIIGAGLTFRSFRQLQQAESGFDDPGHTLTAHLQFTQSRYPRERDITAFYKRVNERLKALPAVDSIGMTTNLPLTGISVNAAINPEGYPPTPAAQLPNAVASSVTPDFFRAMGIRLLAGRIFNERDMDEDAPGVVVINNSMAKRLWPAEDPIGKRLRTSDDANAPLKTIVGVTADIRHESLNIPPRSEIFEPKFREGSRWDARTLVIRTSLDPLRMVSDIENEVQIADPDQPFSRVRTMEDVISDSVLTERFSEVLLAIFAAIGLVLASVGIYGVVSYLVAQRTHEIGLRMALGASQGLVLRIVVGQGLKLALVGVLAGAVGAFALARVMSSVLFGVSSTDPITFVAVGALLAAVAFCGSYLPARRATRVDPMIALRYE
jgi:putative ABC transport system permease protein